MASTRARQLSARGHALAYEPCRAAICASGAMVHRAKAAPTHSAASSARDMRRCPSEQATRCQCCARPAGAAKLASQHPSRHKRRAAQAARATTVPCCSSGRRVRVRRGRRSRGATRGSQPELQCVCGLGEVCRVRGHVRSSVRPSGKQCGTRTRQRTRAETLDQVALSL